MSPISELPILVGPPELLEGPPRDRWLGRVRACRGQMLALLAAEAGHAEAAVEQALGLVLMTWFVRDRRPDASPPQVGSADDTPHGVCGLLRGAVASPLLKAAFDPVGFNEAVALSASAWRDALAADLAWRDGACRVVPMPATALGELHQMCLSERDAGGPGRRRAGGVHYTPVSLADYLTGRVLGGLAAGRGDGPLRILDPSCGGGTFLLAALRWLLGRRGLPPQDALDLIGASLFGIDIDPQAVAWTRRALLLAAWEAMPDADGDANLRVPDLSRNVTCGDFLAPRGVPPAGLPEEFDAVLGGPPFVRIHEMLRDDPARVERYRAAYLTARSGQFDLYMPFFEEAVRRLADGGLLGWSSSSTFLRVSAGRSLRSLLGERCTLRELLEFEDPGIYPDAITQIVLVTLEKGRRDAPCRHLRVSGRGGLRDKLRAVWRGTSRGDITAVELPASRLWAADWSFGSAQEGSLLERIRAAGTPLGRLPVAMCQGLVTGADAVFLLRRVGSTGDGETFVQRRGRRGRHLFLESAVLRPVVRNRDITGYGRLAPRTVCVVPHDDRGRPVPEETLRSRHPKAFAYLAGHREALARRKRAGRWHALRSASCVTLPPGPRLLLKLISSGGDFTLDSAGRYLAHAGVLMLAPDVRRLDPLYLLGVLNSRVFRFFMRQTMPTMGSGRHALRRGTLRQFPVVVSDWTLGERIRIADAVRAILAGGADRGGLLDEIEQLVAGLYGVAEGELAPAA